ncbi:ABC transporter substrate-binding protein [Microtetraspora sp. AC03309]|uniref:ABC transporter substrate-binding protein n=1 Tax=Microtetraspora sp. AC03309 TaxID=2779376 RepID=UPI001E640A9A|nr:ABC transporter substrate-binding protein [Microtetraspora sp. AC03309]MCC5579968.1 ABC transporter substrate-binding protein [Microtetraspora sp. AC03309]
MKRRLAAVTAVLGLGLISACGGSDDGAGATKEAPGGAFTFGAVLADTTLDPDLIPVRQMVIYTQPLYDSLTYLAPDQSVQPMLATEWKAGEDGDGPYLDVTLREGLTFPDGTPFTATTVLANVKRSQTLKQSTNAPELAGVTVEEAGPAKVRFRNPAGVGDLPRTLAGPSGMMISDKAIDGGTDLMRQSAGIGPYTVKTVQPNRIVYTKNPDYWDPQAAASDTLEINYLTDDAKLNAIRTGDLDVTVVPEQMVTAAEAAGYKIERSLGTENFSFSFNTEMKPFDDVRVREAVNLAVDREAICKGLFQGQCEPTGQFFAAGSAQYDPAFGLTAVPFDLEKAKKLIQDAGATGAKAEIVTVAGNQIMEQLASVLQQQMNTIGLQVSVSPVAPPQVVGKFTAEKSVAVAVGASGNTFDPATTVARYVLPTGLYNPGGFRDAEVVRLAAEAVRETDQDKRTEVYRKLSTAVMKDFMFMPILTTKTSYATSSTVSGWRNPWAPAFPSFRGVKG